MTIKDSKYVKINSVNPLYLNENRYLMLAATNGSKEMIKNMKNCGVESVTKNLNDYDKRYMKIKFNSKDELLLNKTIKIPTMKIVARAVFHENNKYYPQVFLDE